MGRLAGLPPPQTIPPSGIICDVWHRRNWQPILNEALGGDNGNDASESEFAGRCCYTRLRGVDRALGCAIVGQDIPYDSRVYCGDAGRGGKEVQYRCIHATRIGRRPNIYHPTIIRPCALRCLYVGAHARPAHPRSRSFGTKCVRPGRCFWARSVCTWHRTVYSVLAVNGVNELSHTLSTFDALASTRT